MKLITALPIGMVAAWMATRTDGTWTPTRYIGLFLILAGLGWLTAARIQLETARSKQIPLATHGLYRRVRHPIYLSSFVAFAGLLLYLDKAWGVPFLLPIHLVHSHLVHREERELEACYGERYRQYKQRTWF